MTDSGEIKTKPTFENDYGDFSQFKRGKSVKQSFFEHIYLQYLLVSGIYMLEPWEQKLFNWILIFIATTFCSIVAFFVV